MIMWTKVTNIVMYFHCTFCFRFRSDIYSTQDISLGSYQIHGLKLKKQYYGYQSSAFNTKALLGTPTWKQFRKVCFPKGITPIPGLIPFGNTPTHSITAEPLRSPLLRTLFKIQSKIGHIHKSSKETKNNKKHVQVRRRILAQVKKTSVLHCIAVLYQ